MSTKDKSNPEKPLKSISGKPLVYVDSQNTLVVPARFVAAVLGASTAIQTHEATCLQLYDFYIACTQPAAEFRVSQLQFWHAFDHSIPEKYPHKDTQEYKDVKNHSQLNRFRQMVIFGKRLKLGIPRQSKEQKDAKMALNTTKLGAWAKKHHIGSAAVRDLLKLLGKSPTYQTMVIAAAGLIKADAIVTGSKSA